MRARIETVIARWEGEPFRPLPEFEVDLVRGRRGKLLRRLAPGVLALLERELKLLWAANESRVFDLDAAVRGAMLSTQAATLSGWPSSWQARLRSVDSSSG